MTDSRTILVPTGQRQGPGTATIIHDNAESVASEYAAVPSVVTTPTGAYECPQTRGVS